MEIKLNLKQAGVLAIAAMAALERAGSWRETLVGVCEPVYRGYDEHTNGQGRTWVGKDLSGVATPWGMTQVSPNTITGGDNGSGGTVMNIRPSRALP